MLSVLKVLLACTAICGLALSAPAWADAQKLSQMPDPRGEFIRLCAPFMVQRYMHPESICDCLQGRIHDTIRDKIGDIEMVDAVLFGITERGVPTIFASLLPPAKRALIDQVMSAVAEPTMACMFGDADAARQLRDIPKDGASLRPVPEVDLSP